MSTPSPGPGWWMASDGEWYPQQWESLFIWQTTRGDLESLMMKVSPIADSYGQKGWEIVNSSVQHTQVGRELNRDGSGRLIFEYSIVITMKRPLKPG